MGPKATNESRDEQKELSCSSFNGMVQKSWVCMDNGIGDATELVAFSLNMLRNRNVQIVKYESSYQSRYVYWQGNLLLRWWFYILAKGLLSISMSHTH